MLNIKTFFFVYILTTSFRLAYSWHSYNITQVLTTENYNKIRQHAQFLLNTTWIQVNDNWFLENVKDFHFKDFSTCLKWRTVFYGDSFLRAIYRSLVRSVIHTPEALSKRYNLKTDNDNGEPNHELWGRQFDTKYLFPDTTNDPNFDYNKKYCGPGGCGCGIDLVKCGNPGRDDLDSIAYSSKSYVSSPLWDKDTMNWASSTNASILFVDAGNDDTILEIVLIHPLTSLLFHLN
jgi:hypothetical protein